MKTEYYRKISREGPEHQKLKDLAAKWLRSLGVDVVKFEVGIPPFDQGFVDVVGFFNSGKTVAIECGHSSLERIQRLKRCFTAVAHIPYCYTPNIIFSKESILRRIEQQLDKYGVE